MYNQQLFSNLNKHIYLTPIMNTKKNKIARYSPTESLGTLTSVNIDYVLREQSIQYLENLSNFCEKMKVNPIWYDSQTTNNKLKFIKIYQFSTQYQNNVQQLYQQKLLQVEKQVLQKRQIVAKRKAQIKKHKRQVQKLKQKYRETKIINVKQVYNHKLYQIKELQRKKKELVKKINKKSRSQSKHQSSQDQDDVQIIQPKICYVPYQMPPNFGGNQQIPWNNSNVAMFSAPPPNQNGQSYNPQQYYYQHPPQNFPPGYNPNNGMNQPLNVNNSNNPVNINVPQNPQIIGNSFGMRTDIHNTKPQIDQDPIAKFAAQLSKKISAKSNNNIASFKNIKKQQKRQIDYDICDKQDEVQKKQSTNDEVNKKQSKTSLNSDKQIDNSKAKKTNNGQLETNSKRSSIQQQKSFQKSNDSFNFDNINILQSNTGKNKKPLYNLNQSKNKEKNLRQSDQSKSSNKKIKQKQALKISEDHVEEQQKDQVSPLNQNSAFSKIYPRQTSILSKRSSGSGFLQNDAELDSFLQIQLANQSKAHLQKIQNKNSLLRSKLGDSNSELSNIIKPPVQKTKNNDQIQQSNLSIESQVSNSLFNTKKSQIKSVDIQQIQQNDKSLKTSTLKIPNINQSLIKAPVLKQVQQKVVQQENYDDQAFEEVQQKVKPKQLKITDSIDVIDKSKIQIQVSPNNSFQQISKQSEFAQLKNKCFELKKQKQNEKGIDNKKSISLVSSSYYFSSLKQLSTFAHKMKKPQNNKVQIKNEPKSKIEDDSFFNDLDDIPLNSVIGKRPMKSKIQKNLLMSKPQQKQNDNYTNIRVLDHTGRVNINQQVDNKLNSTSLNKQQQLPQIDGLLQTNYSAKLKQNKNTNTNQGKINALGLTQSIGFNQINNHKYQANGNSKDLKELQEQIQQNNSSQFNSAQKQQLQLRMINLMRPRQKSNNVQNKNLPLMTQSQILRQIQKQTKVKKNQQKNWKQLETFYQDKINQLKKKKEERLKSKAKQSKSQNNQNVKQNGSNKHLQRKNSRESNKQSKKSIKEQDDDLTFSQSIAQPNKFSKIKQTSNKEKHNVKEEDDQINFDLKENSYIDISKKSVLKNKQLPKVNRQKGQQADDFQLQLGQNSNINKKYTQKSDIFNMQLKQKSKVQKKEDKDDFLNLELLQKSKVTKLNQNQQFGFQLGEKSNINTKKISIQDDFSNLQLKQNSKMLKPPTFSKQQLLASGQNQRRNNFKNTIVQSKYARQASKDKKDQNIMTKISQKHNYDVEDPLLSTINKNKQLFKKVQTEEDYEDDFQ